MLRSSDYSDRALAQRRRELPEAFVFCKNGPRVLRPKDAAASFWAEQGTRGSSFHRQAYVVVSAAYLGATPATWDVTMPDLSAVSGWQNTWGLQTGLATTVGVDAHGVSGNFFFGRPQVGATGKFAGRSSTTATMQMAGMSRQELARQRALRPWMSRLRHPLMTVRGK